MSDAGDEIEVPAETTEVTVTEAAPKGAKLSLEDALQVLLFLYYNILKTSDSFGLSSKY